MVGRTENYTQGWWGYEVELSSKGPEKFFRRKLY